MAEPQYNDYAPKPASPDIHQHLGRLEGRMDGMEERQTRFELRTDTTLGLILDKVDSLNVDRYQAIGGWKAVVVVAGIIVFLAGLATWAISEGNHVQSQAEETNQKLDTLIELMGETLDEETE
jgi:enamine deaminase RidA (YjgF/YER057c/UK114 family)